MVRLDLNKPLYSAYIENGAGYGEGSIYVHKKNGKKVDRD